MTFAELPRGAWFRCQLSPDAKPVNCKKLSAKRFQVMETGKYVTANPRTMPVEQIYRHGHSY
jgi:hypothetical protein